MAEHVTIAASGGTPVTEHPTNAGVPATNAPSGRPVTIVASGGPPVTFVTSAGVLQPGGV